MPDQSEAASQESTSALASAAQHHGFHRVPVARVIDETSDTRSIVLAIPDELADAFSYDAGQFVTFRVTVGDESLMRCYSMSSAPEIDDELTVTVKRVPDGKVSNWLNDNIEAGVEVDVTRPAGVFCLSPGKGDIVAFAAGSGVTPIMSIIKQALATTERRIRVLYANRDADSTIFQSEIAALVDANPGRLTVVHHLDADAGFVDHDELRGFLAAGAAAGSIDDAYVCGPGPFMDLAEEAVLTFGVDVANLHIERFATPPPAPDLAEIEAAIESGEATVTMVTVTVDNKTATAQHFPGTTVLQVARELGLNPPSSCEAGSCATCMGRIIEGTAAMHVNDALTPEEVDEGFILTCQAVPTSEKLEVVYGYD
jgi:3-ketosteroid 9alpha-monooxygenase subunit B